MMKWLEKSDFLSEVCDKATDYMIVDLMAVIGSVVSTYNWNMYHVVGIYLYRND